MNEKVIIRCETKRQKKIYFKFKDLNMWPVKESFDFRFLTNNNSKIIIN